MKFTTNQFLLVLLINVIFLLAVAGHYFSETVRTEVEHDTKIVYKDRTVNKCEATEEVKQLMQAATDRCNTGNSNGLQKFSLDANGKPIITCKTQ